VEGGGNVSNKTQKGNRIKQARLNPIRIPAIY
jgi:hypothetical protein